MIQLKLLEHRLLRYAGITLGCMIASCSINLFLVPSHLLTGGATGIAMIVYYLTHLPIGAQTFAYNIPLLMAAWRLLGKGYTCDVVIGTAIFSFCLDFTKPLNAYAPVNDYMLAAIFGGVFNGIGYGIVFRMNGSTGGFDIVGAIAKKFYSFNMGGVIFGFNCLVMLAAAFMFGVAPAMFTLICMFMNAMVTDKVIAGFNSRKALRIQSGRGHSRGHYGSRPWRNLPAWSGGVYTPGTQCGVRGGDLNAGGQDEDDHKRHRPRCFCDYHVGKRSHGAWIQFTWCKKWDGDSPLRE